MSRHAVAIVSGGLDSVTLAWKLHDDGYDLTLLSVDYGQRHVKELAYAELAARRLDADHQVVDLTGITRLLTGSALTDGTVDVPHGHYAEESMRATVVPNRNAMLLSVAVAAAVARGAELVATGVHAGDHAVYPDCRPAFVDSFNAMARIATDGFAVPDFRVVAPFVHIGKHDIVALGSKLGVPFIDTWSCYEGRDLHCGHCGTCVERIEAFALAGVDDPTPYYST